MKTKWIKALRLLLVATGTFMTGCERGGNESPQTSPTGAADSSGTEPAQPGKDGEPAPETGSAAVNVSKIKVSAVDLAGYQELVQSHAGKVVLADAWATW
ncbi:MAG: hypothetical protein VB853_08915 [Pirellulales bacterium]